MKAMRFLTVVTHHGDYVLDNLVENVRSWESTDYRWIERQNPNDGWAWVVLFSRPKCSSRRCDVSPLTSVGSTARFFA